MKLIILDRDGVINHESDAFIKSPDEWSPLPGSLEAIARLKKNGYTIAVATNQSGIGRGYFSQETLAAIHHKMQSQLALLGAEIDAIFYCPHIAEDNCFCRKPKPGLLHQISHHFHCDLTNIPIVGDSMRDMQAALAVGAKPILVKTGRGMHSIEQGKNLDALSIYDDLASVVAALCQS